MCKYVKLPNGGLVKKNSIIAIRAENDLTLTNGVWSRTDPRIEIEYGHKKDMKTHVISFDNEMDRDHFLVKLTNDIETN
jgi:hypothetical protein